MDSANPPTRQSLRDSKEKKLQRSGFTPPNARCHQSSLYHDFCSTRLPHHPGLLSAVLSPQLSSTPALKALPAFLFVRSWLCRWDLIHDRIFGRSSCTDLEHALSLKHSFILALVGSFQFCSGSYWTFPTDVLPATRQMIRICLTYPAAG